jgi:hypothetical protein
MTRGLLDRRAADRGVRIRRGPGAAPARPVAGIPGQLPASHWRRYPAVRWPGTTEDRIDEVVVGPSGVHVVLRARGDETPQAACPEGSPVDAASGAADAVAGLLPARYRDRVHPELRLDDTQDVASRVGRVLLASPPVLEHIWRSGPRVLSTSEVDDLRHRLDAALEPLAVETPPAPRWRWLRWRPRRRRAAGA